MKKIFGLVIVFFITCISAISADMRFIQVDGALFNSNTPEHFDKLINKINNEKEVKFIVFTGNNISKPNQEELKIFLSKAKKLKRPFYVILGQKDVNLKKGLGKKDYMRIVRKNNFAHRNMHSPNYIFNKKDIIFIVADGSKEVIPTPIGYYREDVILWLDEKLDDYKDKNVIILQHYPIIPPANKETHYTYKADEYLKLLSEHKNVKAVISGHFDVNKEQEVNGILHISTKNAPIYRVIDILDYETENPTFWSTIKE
jgi:Icc protein